MDDWENFNGTSLPKKEDFYNLLSTEYITDTDYTHVKKGCKDLKNIFDMFQVALYTFYIFENFTTLFSKLDPTRFHSALGLAH